MFSSKVGRDVSSHAVSRGCTKWVTPFLEVEVRLTPSKFIIHFPKQLLPFIPKAVHGIIENVKRICIISDLSTPYTHPAHKTVKWHRESLFSVTENASPTFINRWKCCCQQCLRRRLEQLQNFGIISFCVLRPTGQVQQRRRRRYVSM